MAADRKSGEKKQPDGLDQSIESFRASLEHSVTVSRERLQEVLDDAVKRGRMTRRDAEGMISELLEKGRKHRDSMLEELEKMGKELNRQSTKLAKQARDATEKPLAKADRLRRRANIGSSFPITGYDELTAAQIKSRLGDLTPAELRAVRTREQKGAGRKTILGAIDKKLG